MGVPARARRAGSRVGWWPGRTNKRRWRPGTWRRDTGEGKVTGRDPAGAVPSEGCRARPSSPRKALLVSSSSAHSGDVGAALHSGSGGTDGPRGTQRGPRMSAMLKGVRTVWGSGSEPMAGQAVAVLPPASLGSDAS